MWPIFYPSAKAISRWSPVITATSGSTLELLMLHPDRILPVVRVLANRVASHNVSAICGPLIEGAFVGFIVASTLDLPFTYSQPALKTEPGLFPVKYTIPKTLRSELRGKRVAVVNDVINAGSAVRGTIADLQECGAEPVVIATLAVLGDSAGELAKSENVTLESLAFFPNRIWEPTACPLCAKGISLSD